MNCFDCADPAAMASKAKALYGAGIRYVIAYINPGYLSGAKTIKPAHCAELHAAGLGIAFVCEGYGGSDNFSHHDITAATGAHDGQVCASYMKNVLSVPAGVMCAPTIDNDISAGQIASLGLPYAKAFRAALDVNYAFGFYSAGAMLFALEDAKVALDYPWLSNAGGWSRTHEYAATGRAKITQQRDTHFMGLDIDPNVLAAGAEKAFWMPANTVQPLDR